MPPGPPRPKLGGIDRLFLRFLSIVDPRQLEIGIAKEEAAACRALAGVPIGVTLRQPELDETVSLGTAQLRPYEEVVEFKHKSAPGHEKTSARYYWSTGMSRKIRALSTRVGRCWFAVG